MEVPTASALRQWQHGLALEVVIQIHTLGVEAARAPAKPWTVAPRFHLVNLCEVHDQRAGIPRGADVIHQVSLQPPL